VSGLRRFGQIPAGLLAAEAQELAALLGGPALLHLKAEGGQPSLRETTPEPQDARIGDAPESNRIASAPASRAWARTAPRKQAAPRALFVSVLLHGNETSGWYAVRELLRNHQPLPWDLLLFIGNVQAAAQGVRTLPNQQDFNRMWQSPQGIAQEVLRAAAKLPLFAVVDLHNNTGKNPHYSVLTDFSPGSLGLAAHFGNRAIFIEEPATVLTRAFSPRTPNVALELGSANDRQAWVRGYDFLRGLLELDDVAKKSAQGMQLYRTLARVHVRTNARFDFLSQSTESGMSPSARPNCGQMTESGAALETSEATEARAVAEKGAISEQPPTMNGLDLVLDDAIEAANFTRLPPGTSFGFASAGVALKVLDNRRREVTHRYFETRSGRILLKVPVVPAMYTTNVDAARQDCLCYFMERIDLG